MPQSSRRQAITLSIVALGFIIIAQVIIWLQEKRLNPGLIAAAGLVFVLLLSMRRKDVVEKRGPGS